MEDRIERRSPWIPWAITSVALVLVAVAAYGIGAHQEATVVGGDPAARVWHHHGFPGIWLFFLLFWLFGGLRWMWWGRGYGYHPRGYRRYGRGWSEDERDDWEAWHRREHERMDAGKGQGPSPAPGAGQSPVS